MPRRRSAAPGRPQRRSALATWVPAVAFATAATTAATLYAYHVPHNEEVAAIRKTWAELGNFDKLFIEYSRVNSTAVPYRVFTDVTEDEANRRAAARDGATAVQDAKTALVEDPKKLDNFDKLFIEYSRVNSTAVPYRVFTDVTEDEADRRAAARDGATAVEEAKTALGKRSRKARFYLS